MRGDFQRDTFPCPAEKHCCCLSTAQTSVAVFKSGLSRPALFVSLRSFHIRALVPATGYAILTGKLEPTWYVEKGVDSSGFQGIIRTPCAILRNLRAHAKNEMLQPGGSHVPRMYPDFICAYGLSQHVVSVPTGWKPKRDPQLALQP